MFLYLTRKARRREEQSCSHQEELQRNGASDGRGIQAAVGAKTEHIGKVNTSLTERGYERG